MPNPAPPRFFLLLAAVLIASTIVVFVSRERLRPAAHSPAYYLAESLGSPATAPEREPRIVAALLIAYRKQYGEFPPVGSNRECLAALRRTAQPGETVLPAAHPRVSADDQLLDAWGAALAFRVPGPGRVEVRSAGPDGRLDTADDASAVAAAPDAPAS